MPDTFLDKMELDRRIAEMKDRELPTIGDIIRGEKREKTGRFYIWQVCPDCGQERWVECTKGGKPRSNKTTRCIHCAVFHRSIIRPKGFRHWKGGKYKDNLGYINIWVHPADFFALMRKSAGYVLEHRLVMAKHLGRCLHRWEIVHHKNGIRDDNRIENLQLVSDTRHNQITILENRIALLEQRVTLLEAENILLRHENERTKFN